MSDDETQASAEAVAVQDNPSVAEAQLEQGPPAATPEQEHRDILAELDKLDPKLLYAHPLIKGELARRTKSAQDRAYYQGQQAALAEAANRRQQEDTQKLLEEGDEYEIGRRFKEEALRRKTLDPLLEAAKKAGYEDGFSRGYSIGLGELGAALEEIPYWRDEMSRVEREAFMEDTGAARDFLAKVMKEGITRGTNKELKKLQEKQAREAEIEGRAGEPSPTVGSGTPSGGDKQFLADFASGRNSDFKRAEALIGKL